MKIKKGATLVKPKHNQLDKALQPIEAALRTCKDEELLATLRSIDRSAFRKGDLYYWIDVLNRFDDVLENSIKKSMVLSLTPEPEDAENTLVQDTPNPELIVEILSFTEILLDKFKNKQLYSSIEHVCYLLNSESTEVVHAATHLLYNMATSSRSSLGGHIIALSKKLLVFAYGHTSLSIKDAVTLRDLPDKVISDGASLRYEFYRDTYERDQEKATNAAASLADGHKKKAKKDHASLAKKTGDQKKDETGVTVINISNVSQESASNGEGVFGLFRKLVAENNIPERYQFSLWTRMRLANDIRPLEKRILWAKIRLYSLTIMARANQNSEEMTMFFHHNPEFIPELAAILRAKDVVPREVIEAVLRVLFACCSNRSRAQEIVRVLLPEDNTYDALLPMLVRDAVSTLTSPSMETMPYDYDTLLDLVNVMSTTNIGSQSLQDSGLLTESLAILNVRKKGTEKILAKYLVILETLMQAHHPSIPQVLEAGALTRIISLLNDEVTEIHGEVEKMRAKDKSTDSTTKDVIPSERLQLLHSIFRALSAIINTNSTLIRPREILETSFSTTLLNILELPQYYGGFAFSLAGSTLSSLINNDPTCFPLVEQKGLVTVIINTMKNLPPNADVISIIAPIITAFCLSEAGQQIVRDADPYGSLLKVLIDPKYEKVVAQGDIATLMGTDFNELMRHVPATREAGIDAAVALLTELQERSERDQPDIEMTSATTDTANATSSTAQPKEPSKEKLENQKRLAIAVSNVSKMLSTLLQNAPEPSRLFVEKGGLRTLLKICERTSDAQSVWPALSYLNGHQPAQVFKAVLEAVSNQVNALAQDGSPSAIKEHAEVNEDQLHKLAFIANMLNFMIKLQYTSSVTEWSRANGNDLLEPLAKLNSTVLWKLCCKLTEQRQKEQQQQQQQQATEEGEQPKKKYKSERNVASSSSSSPAEPLTPSKVHKKKTIDTAAIKVSTVLRAFSASVSYLQETLETAVKASFSQAASQPARTLATALAKCIIGPLTYFHELSGDLEPKCCYLEMAVNAASRVIFDERRKNVDTLVLSEFKKEGGVDRILQAFEEVSQLVLDLKAQGRLGTDKEKSASSTPTKELKDKKAEEDKPVHDDPHEKALASCARFMSRIVSPQHVVTSPMTTNMVISSDSAEGFDPATFVAELQKMVARSAIKVWQHQSFPQLCEPFMVHFITTIAHILKGVEDKETKGIANRLTGAAAKRPAPALVPDATAVTQLMEMGFPRNRAEEALRATQNNVVLAMEWIWSNPEPEAPPPQQQQQQESEVLSEEDELARAIAMSLGEGGADEQKKEEEGAAPEDVQIPEVNPIQIIREGVLSWSINLLHKPKDYSLACSDLLNLLCKDKSQHAVVIDTLTKSIKTLATDSNAGEEPLSSLLHCAGLLLQNNAQLRDDISKQESFVDLLLHIVRTRLETLSSAKKSENTNNVQARIISACLLAFDALCQPVPLEQPDAERHTDKKTSSSSTSSEGASKAPATLETLKERAHAYMSQYDAHRLMDVCVQMLLNSSKLNSDIVQGLLKVIAKITVSQEDAKKILDNGCLQALLGMPVELRCANHAVLAETILRHAIEDQSTLQSAMETELKKSVPKLIRQNGRLNVSSFVRSFASMFRRDPDAFFKAVQATCSIKAGSPSVSLKENLLPSQPAPESLEAMRRVLYALLDFLVAPPVAVKDSVKAKDKGKGKLTAVHDQADNNESNAERRKLALSKHHLVQFVADFVASYNGCADHVLSYTNPAMKTNIVRWVLLNVVQYACSPSQREQDELFRKKMQENKMGTYLISALFSHQPQRVLAEITSLLKDSKSLPHPLRAIHSTSDLLFLFISNKLQKNAAASEDLAKMLVRAGIVDALTRCLAVIDLNHPDAVEVTNSVLKVLEHLTRVSRGEMPVDEEKGKPKPVERAAISAMETEEAKPATENEIEMDFTYFTTSNNGNEDYYARESDEEEEEEEEEDEDEEEGQQEEEEEEEEEPEEEEEDNVDEGDGGEHPALMSDSDSEMSEEVMSDANSIRAQLQMLDGSGEDLAVQFGELEDALEIRLNIGGIASTLIRGSRSGNYAELFDGLFNLARGRAATLRPAATSNIEYQPISFSSGSTVPPPQPLARDRSLFSSAGLFGSGWNEVVPMRPARMYGSNRWSEDGLESSLSSSSALLSNIEAVITQLIQEKKPVEKEEKKDEKKESKKESSGLFGEDEDEDDDNDEDDKDEHREDHEERAAIPAAVESTSTTAAQSSPMEVDQSTVNTSSSTLDTTSASSAPTEETNAAPQPPAAIPPEQQPTTTTSATVAAASEADSSPMELDQSSSSVQQLSAQTSDQTAQQQEARPDEQQAAQGSVQEAQEASTTATTSPSTTDAQAQPQQSTEQQVEQSAPSNVDAAQGAAASSSSSSSSAPDFGLDPTFLAALPEDLRREVLSTHIAQLMSTHRASGGSATDSIIDPQFLAALPADIQAEVLEQERLIREANRPADSNNAQDMDIASFIATLSPDLREEVLLTSDDSVLSTLPPELAAEAHALRERYNRRYARPQFARRGGGAIGANPSRRDSASQQPAPGTQPLKSQDEENKGEPVVSDEALVSLVKLLYICQPISKVLLQKTLLNLCAHSHSRATLVKLFMGMLEFHDSTERVPEEFAPVVSSRLLGIPSHAALPSSNDPGNSIPKMVLRRALDILIFLAKNNNRVLALLVSGFKKKKKKDEKEETPSTKKDEKRVAAQQPEQLPVSKLFGLVSDPQFVHSNELLENLLQLLDITVDFLNKLIREAARRKEAKRKRAEEKKKAEKEKAEAEEKKKKEEEERAAATASSTTTTTTTTSAAAPTTEVRDEVMVDTEKKPEHKEESEEEEEDELNIPVSIFSAEANLRHLVQVLVRDECSEQAVQRAESVMNNVCLAAPKSRSVVLKELSGLIMEEARQVARLFDMSPTVSGNKSSSSSAATTGQDPLSAHESKFRRIIKTYAAIYAPEKHKKAAPTRRIADDESDSSQSEEENDDLFVARTRSPIVSSVEGAKDNSASAQPEAADEKRFNYFREDSLDFLWDKMQAFISQQTINNAEAAAAAATTMTVAPLAPPPTVPSPIASPSAVIGARAAAATNSSGPAADSVFSAKILPLVEAFFIFQSMFIKDNEEEKRQQEAGGRRKPGEKPKVALAPMLPPSPTIAKAMEQVEGASGPIDFNALLNAPNANASQQQKPAISRLEQFMADNRKALNSLVRANPNLLKGSLSLMMKFPKHVDFDNKRTWFRQKLKSRQDPYGGARITVRRKHIFVDSYYHLRMRTPEELKGHLSVRFEGEEGVDAGGLTREWFLELSREMFNPNYALFVPSADGSTYQPSPLSYMNGDHISYFKFVGRVIGMAIYNEQLLDAYFTRSFYKHILGIPISYHDIESIDPEYYRTLRWMLENDVTHMDFVFAVDHEEFGKRSEVELKEGGANIAVTNANKGEYVRLITELKMTKSIQAQISAFLEGFHELVPPELIRVFDERELELLISGLPDIDIADLKANTVYHNQYSPSHPVIQWFWRAVDSLDREERAHLVQFVTGTSKVPLDGFASLQGMHGVQKFNIHRVPGGANANNRLPTAHTCFNQLDLPEYTSYEVLRKNLLLAIREGHEGFGFV